MISIVAIRHIHPHLISNKIYGCCGVQLEDFIWSVNYLKQNNYIWKTLCGLSIISNKTITADRHIQPHQQLVEIDYHIG